MRYHRAPVAWVLLGLTALLCLVASASVIAASAQLTTYWLPRQTSLADLPQVSATYFAGLSGFVVGVTADQASALAAAGGHALDLLPGETLYVFLLKDAERAAFEAPARVLLRAGNEVFVATQGEAPLLTLASDRSLTGLRQPVRIDLVSRRPYPVPAAPSPPPSRTEDPLVREMVNQVTLNSYVATWQSLDDFETRQTYQPGNLAASQWILNRFLSYGLRAGFHYYEQAGEKRNVIATLPGRVDSTRVVYICGHFDSTSPTPITCAPGADDNGSGTNAVLEAARVLSQYAFAYTIKFACFNGEEQGMRGSSAYVTEIGTVGEDVVGVYNCDMIAYRGLDPAPADLVLYTNDESQWLATILSDVISTYLLGSIEPVVLVQEMTSSDHSSFWNWGYSAICAIEDEAWGDDFCPVYHTCSDRIEFYAAADRGYAVSCTKANLAAVATIAVPLADPSAVEAAQPFSRLEVQVAPNPSAGIVRLRRTGSLPGPTTIRIFDPAGRLVRTLWDGAMDAGPINIPWDGCDEEGGRVKAGVYFVRLAAGRNVSSQRMVVTR